MIFDIKFITNMGCGSSQHVLHPSQNQLVAHQAKCYLVTCMDFRLIDDIVKHMDKIGYNNNYDQFILAGSSLGFTQQKFKHWGQTLNDHMGIGQSLHNFRQIIFIDHIDCGAYKKFYPDIKNHQDQKKYHKIHMQKARDTLALKFPKFQFQGFLMDLHGKCQPIQVDTEKVTYIDHKTSQKENFLAGISS